MEDSESLFEGMVLFNPNSSFPEEQQHQDHHQQSHDPISETIDEEQQQQDDHDHDHEEEEESVSTISITNLDESTSSEPLDESLFSDLTIVTTTAMDSDLNPNPNPSTSGFSRQISRKKKRASLRIGYGRNSFSSSSSAAEDRTDVVEVRTDSVEEDRRGDSGEELGLEKIRKRIGEEVEAARRKAAEVSEARKAAMAGRRKAAERLREAERAHAELEGRLEEACESEDFEAAERLSDALAALDSERVSLSVALRDAEAECDSVEAGFEAALAAQIAAEENCASVLRSFAKDASSKADLVIRTAHEASMKQMEKWNSSTEALELRRMELEIESQIVGEARVGLNTSIDHLVEDDNKERDCLCKKKDALVDELQKLLILVKQKEQEIAETDLNIEAVDERISGVVSGYQDTRSGIESKVSLLQSGLSEIETETRDLSTQKKEIDEICAREEEEAAKLRELAKDSEEEAKAYLDVVELRKNLMVSVLKSRADKVKLAKTEEKLSDEVQTLQQVISSSRASLQELSAKKSSIQQDIASSKQKLHFTEKRIPELEAEKKVAAAARNFKEAARIAAEAKSLTTEKDRVQSDMERAVLDLELLESEIKDTVEKLQETNSLLSSKQKEVAMTRFERLLLVAGSARAERAAALEFGNHEEADLLLLEAESADSEAETIQPIYDFKLEDFANVPKRFISIELVANLGKKQLEELVSSVQLSPA